MFGLRVLCRWRLRQLSRAQLEHCGNTWSLSPFRGCRIWLCDYEKILCFNSINSCISPQIWLLPNRLPVGKASHVIKIPLETALLVTHVSKSSRELLNSCKPAIRMTAHFKGLWERLSLTSFRGPGCKSYQEIALPHQRWRLTTKIWLYFLPFKFSHLLWRWYCCINWWVGQRHCQYFGKHCRLLLSANVLLIEIF